MDKKQFSELTEDKRVIEAKKEKNAKIINATLIGFLVGILIFGIVSWSLSSDKRVGFFIPMLIPVYMIYRLIKNKKDQ